MNRKQLSFGAHILICFFKISHKIIHESMISCSRVWFDKIPKRSEYETSTASNK